MKHESVMFKKLVKMRDFCKYDPAYLWVLHLLKFGQNVLYFKTV